MNIGAAFTEFRTKQGRTVKEVAEAIHVLPKSLENFESNNNTLAFWRLVNACTFLEIKMSDLFLRAEEI